MLNLELQRELEAYLEANYSEERKASDSIPRQGPDLPTSNSGILVSVISDLIPSDNVMKDGGHDLSEKETKDLEDLVDEVGESFHDMLFRLIQNSAMTDVEIYKKANVDRRLFSKLRNNPAYHPSKQTVLALAIALRLSLDETVDLLSRAEYALSPGSKGDLIVKYFIEHGIFDIMTINFALEEYGQALLG